MLGISTFVEQFNATTSPPRTMLRKYKSVLLVLSIASVTSQSVLANPAASSVRPEWLSKACFEIALNAWDKFAVDPNYQLSFTVQEDGGRTYIATRDASSAGDPSRYEVHFPRDFKDKKNGLQADADCFRGRDYHWSIAVNGKIKDSGNFSFKRSPQH